MAMQITPSAKSSFLAGFCLSVIAWLTILKLDSLAKFLHLERFLNQKKWLDWMSDNKTLTLLFTEFINYGMHGITSTTATTFALGSTTFNAIAIFVGLPVRSLMIKRSKRRALLEFELNKQVIQMRARKSA